MGSKPAAHTKAFVSSVKTLYYEATWLVLPLLDNGGKIYQKKKKNEKRTLELQSDGKTSGKGVQIIK